MDADRNDRRCSLIHKKHLGGGITDAEQTELDVLQHEMEEELRPEAERQLAWLKDVIKENDDGR